MNDRRAHSVRHALAPIARFAAAVLGVAVLVTCSQAPHGERGGQKEPTESASTPAPAAPLTVGTFNIRYDNPGDGANRWSRRREMVVAVLREGDVWGLQEALPSQVAELERALPAFGVVSRTRERDPEAGEACPIFFRRDRVALDADDHGTFWLSPTPDEPGSRGWEAALPRIATWARLVDRDGRGLYLFNAHFDHRGEVARRESARVLLARIADRRHPEDPVVLVGDLNAGPDSDAVRALLAAADPPLADAWRATNPAAPEQPTFNGWRERCEGARIDWILVSPGVAVDACTVDLRRPDGRWPSDHAPVVARLAPAAATGR